MTRGFLSSTHLHSEVNAVRQAEYCTLGCRLYDADGRVPSPCRVQNQSFSAETSSPSLRYSCQHDMRHSLLLVDREYLSPTNNNSRRPRETVPSVVTHCSESRNFIPIVLPNDTSRASSYTRSRVIVSYTHILLN
jgi:hypothetical protein